MNIGKLKHCFKTAKINGLLIVALVISIVIAYVSSETTAQVTPIAEETLRFVSIVHRHGQRNPERSYPKDPYKNDSYWPEGLGMLTTGGKQGLYKLGKFLRYRYGRFLSAEYSPNEIYVQSSYVDRCLMSAEFVLAGLYPPEGKSIWNPDLMWEAIPVHTTPFEYDDKIWVTGKPCALLTEEDKRYESIEQMILDENKEIIANITKNTGAEIKKILDIYYIYDNLLVKKEYNDKFYIEDWAKGDDWIRLQHLARFETLQIMATPIMIKLKSGVLINEIISNMKQKAKSPENFKRLMNLYSAHDQTIVLLSKGLNITSTNYRRPPYGSALIIELHEINGRHQVKIFYKEGYDTEELEALETRGCKQARTQEPHGTCDLETFATALKSTAIEDFDEACRIPDTNASNQLFHIQSIFNMICIAASSMLVTF